MKRGTLTPLDAMTDPALWGGTFGGSSWKGWRSFVAAAQGLPLDAEGLSLYRRCTGRQNAPKRAAKVIACLAGRRSGKSLTAAFLATAHAVLSRPKLAPGERPVVLVCAVTQRQARVLHDYCAGLLAASPLTAAEVVSQTAGRIELRNGTTIEIRSSDFKKVRGVTAIACVLDEGCFLRSEESATPDVELFRALKPALATTGGPFIAISSPWSRRGLMHQLWKRHYGKDDSDTLVWVAPSDVMNPTLPAEIIAEAMQDDPVAARSEWLGAWREDVEPFLSESALDAVTAERRTGDLPPVPAMQYAAFLDPSGGSQDAFALCIAHGERRGVLWTSVVDVIEEVRPPFDAEKVVAQFADTLKAYGITHAKADKYAGVWVVEAFQRHGILIEQNAAPKSEMYLSFLPLVTARRVELPNDAKLLSQLAQLARRSRSGGRDVVDHPPGAHDDRANVVAGACVEAAQPGPSIGILARNLAPAPVRQGLNLLSGDPLAAAVESFDYENEDVLWRLKGESPPWPSDDW